ncbi:hypothetical protein ACFYZ4_25640 [Streptomyces sp. NPDC001513]|uniref:hypothetical protein n=1 Tax=Streptomyces sp. NPDC001513 TaxID=3364580 RepID=UPI00369F7969
MRSYIHTDSEPLPDLPDELADVDPAKGYERDTISQSDLDRVRALLGIPETDDPESVATIAALLEQVGPTRRPPFRTWKRRPGRTGKVFTQENGAWLHPETASDTFRQILARTDLTPITFVLYATSRPP